MLITGACTKEDICRCLVYGSIKKSLRLQGNVSRCTFCSDALNSIFSCQEVTSKDTVQKWTQKVDYNHTHTNYDATWYSISNNSKLCYS